MTAWMHLEEIWGESIRSDNLTRYKWQNDSAWNWPRDLIWKHNIYLFFERHYHANYYLDCSKPLIKILLTWEARVVSDHISLNEHKLITTWFRHCLIMFEPKITTTSKVPRNTSMLELMAISSFWNWKGTWKMIAWANSEAFIIVAF